jgi:POT family proton-dependent oligopeptide transporter
MVVGALLITLGHIALGVSGLGGMAMDSTGMAVFVFGMAIITIGTGHFKPSVSVQVGDLYPPGDPRRDGAFSIFYMGINLGAFLCNIVCGTLAATYGWHYGFAAAAAGMIMGLLFYLWGKPKYLQGIGETDSPHRNKAWIFLPIGIVLAAGVAWLFHLGVLGLFDQFVSQQWVFMTLIVLSLAYAVWFIAKQEPGDRGPVATIFIYMLFNAIFWLSFEQAGSSLTTFTDELTDRRLGFIWDKVPTPQFQSVNPLLIILFAPIAGVLWVALAKRGRSFGQPFKIGTGLIFVGLGYVVMFMAAMKLNTGVSKVSMLYICGCYFLHTVGEIILSPTGLAYVSKTAPKRYMSSLMGIWFISSFVAGLAAGKLAALVDPIIEGKVKLPWKFGGQADFFLLFVASSCAAGLLIIAVGPLLIRLQRVKTD